jgi:hypothetical protein
MLTKCMLGINANKHVLYGVVAVVLWPTVGEGSHPSRYVGHEFLRRRFFVPSLRRHTHRQVNAIAVYDIPTQSNIAVLIKYHYKTTVEGIHNVLALSYLAYGFSIQYYDRFCAYPSIRQALMSQLWWWIAIVWGTITLQVGPYNNNEL